MCNIIQRGGIGDVIKQWSNSIGFNEEAVFSDKAMLCGDRGLRLLWMKRAISRVEQYMPGVLLQFFCPLILQGYFVGKKDFREKREMRRKR